MNDKNYESLYTNTNIHTVYSKSRTLPQETISMWLTTMASILETYHIKTIIDLGCGTGRFTKALADYFDCSVIGIDPSKKMLTEAEQSVTSDKINFIDGNSGSMNIESSSADLIFMSQVYHHVIERVKFREECNRVLKKGGYVCIRNSCVDNMESYLYPRFFPSALAIDMNKLPVRKDVVELFTGNSFEKVFCEPVEQIFANNHIEYYEKVSLKGCSDLAMINDEEFSEGLQKLKDYCYANKDNGFVYEDIDLFIFRKL